MYLSFLLRIKHHIVFIFCITCGISYAQNLRIEIESTAINDNYNVLPIAENGMFIFYKPHVKADAVNKEIWFVSKYDTLFNEEWTTEIAIQSKQNYLSAHYLNDYLYILFGKSKSYQIVQIDISTGEWQLIKGKTEHESYEVYDFKVIDNFAFITGATLPSQNLVFYRSVLSFLFFPLSFVPGFIPTKSAYIIHQNLTTKAVKDLNIDLKGTSMGLEIMTDTLSGRVWVACKSVVGKKTNLQLFEYKYSGAKSKVIALKTFTKQYQLFDGKLSSISAKEKVLAGTYGRKRTTGSQGIYVTKINGNKQEFINYQSFSNFKHFFEYMPKNEKQKLEHKITKKKSRGKDLSHNYQVMVHDIMADTSTCTILAEVYAPMYHTEYQMIWSYGRPVETAVEIFDGYKYTHAVLASFDKNGNLLWDNSLVINDITTFELSRKVKSKRDANGFFTLAYNNLGNVAYKIMKDSITIEEKTLANDFFKEDDQTQFEFFSDIVPWYGNYFISYGSKSVKNREDEFLRKRKNIFYFNKLELNVKQ